MKPEHRESHEGAQIEKENQSLNFGVAFLVPENVARDAFKMRDEISQTNIPMDSILSTTPHITIFQGEFSQTSVNEIEAKVKSILQEFHSINFEMEDKLIFHPSGYILWDVKKNEDLWRLHEKVVDELVKIPSWKMMKQFRDRIAGGEFTPAQIEHVQKYGVISAGPNFSPHLTLGKAKDSRQLEVLKLIDVPKGTKFAVNEVIGGPIDYFGSMSKSDFEAKLDM